MRFKLFGGADCTDMFLAQLVPIVALSQTGDINELQEVASKVLQLMLMTSTSSSTSSGSEILLEDLVNAFSSSSSSQNNNNNERGKRSSSKTNTNTSTATTTTSSTNIDLGLACCALHTIFTNIAIYNLDVQQSNKELVILGLSESVANLLSEMAVSNRRDILSTMANQVRMAPNVARVHVMKEDASGKKRKKNKKQGVEEDNDDEDDLPPGEDPAVNYVVTLDRRLTSSSASSSDNKNSSGNNKSSSNNVLSFSASSERLKSLLVELIAARESM